MTRWHDWPPNALYLEEWFRLNGLAELNVEPAYALKIAGEVFDMMKVPRLAGFYSGRII